MSKRDFDGRVKAWRRALHKWDNPDIRPDLIALSYPPRPATREQLTNETGKKRARVEDGEVEGSDTTNDDASPSKGMKKAKLSEEEMLLREFHQQSHQEEDENKIESSRTILYRIGEECDDDVEYDSSEDVL